MVAGEVEVGAGELLIVTVVELVKTMGTVVDVVLVALLAVEVGLVEGPVEECPGVLLSVEV